MREGGEGEVGLKLGGGGGIDTVLVDTAAQGNPRRQRRYIQARLLFPLYALLFSCLLFLFCLHHIHIAYNRWVIAKKNLSKHSIQVK